MFTTKVPKVAKKESRANAFFFPSLPSVPSLSVTVFAYSRLAARLASSLRSLLVIVT